ncbi:hypothetical protein EDD18DRAFT_1344621 [Armillaria luteobubalina]|uniref:Uncharacterized protein n=1 Tax=Armillaria luteobubalina TaxID=153913 RepID=A0AA39V372_9AGAR|nr:hypothetical protein EDD18DRAFT_1344621 [Armillaria luteobubalina]
MPQTPSAVPAQSAVTSASDFVLLMAALANLNLSNGTTLMTTTTTTNSLHLPASSAGVSTPTLPMTATSTTSIGSPSTTTSISLTTATTPTAHTTTNTTPDLPHLPTVWLPHNNFYVITCGQEVRIFFTWTETAERVIGVPGNVYEWKNNYYNVVNVYHQAYNKEQVHVTSLASSRFDVSIEDEWSSLDWG